MADPISQDTPSKLKRLNPRHMAIVKAYTTPGPTMGNMTASGKAVNPGRSNEAARQSAWRAFKHPEVREAIAEEMAKHDANIGWRVKTLRAVGDPSTILTETRETLNPNGDLSKTTIRRSPSPADIARIVDVLNKMDGIYNQQAAAAAVTQRYASLASRFRVLLADPKDDYAVDVPKLPQIRTRSRPRQYIGGLPVKAVPENLFKAGSPPNAHSEPTDDPDAVKAE